MDKSWQRMKECNTLEYYGVVDTPLFSLNMNTNYIKHAPVPHHTTASLHQTRGHWPLVLWTSFLTLLQMKKDTDHQQDSSGHGIYCYSQILLI